MTHPNPPKLDPATLRWCANFLRGHGPMLPIPVVVANWWTKKMAARLRARATRLANKSRRGKKR